MLDQLEAWTGSLQGYLQGPRGSALLRTLLSLLILFVILWQAIKWYETRLLRELRTQANVEASLRANAVSASINRRFALVQGLAAFVQADVDAPDFPRRFRTYAAGIYNSVQGVRNIALAPSGVIQYVYPLEGNEPVLGYEPAKDPRPEVRADIQQALESDQIILSGPMELVQGGLGLIASKAVFLDQEYWGLVRIVLDLPPILARAGLNAPSADFEFAIRDDAGKVFFGPSSIFQGDPVIESVILAEGQWDLAGIPLGGWETAIRPEMLIFQIVGLAIIALTASLVYMTTNRQARLALAVEQRTQEISQINAQLEEDIAERRRAETALRSSEERLATVLQLAADAIIVIDEKQKIQLFNKAAEKIYGYTEAEIVGKPLDLLIPHRFQLLHRKHVANFGTSQESIRRMAERQEVFGLRKDGSEFPAEASISKLSQGSQLNYTVVVRDITRRKQIEDELREKERLYRTLAHNFPNGAVILFDHNLRYTIADGAGLEDIGLSSQMLEGKTIWELFPPETCEQIEPAYRAALKGETSIIEVPFTDRIYRLHALPLRNERDEIFAGMAMTQDITERKRADEVIRVSEAQNRALLDTIPDLIFRIHKDGTFLDARGIQENAGVFPPGFEIIGRNVRDLPMTPEVSRQIFAAIDAALSSGQIQSLDYELQATGGSRSYETRITRSGPDEIVAIARDVTERKLTEAALLEREMQYRQVFELVLDGLFINDLGGNLVAFNPAAHQMHGYTAEEFSRLHPSEFIHPEHHYLFRDFIEAIQEGNTFRTRAIDVRKDGTPLHVEVYGTPFSHGGQPHALAIVRDVTDQVEAYQLLERRVEERTRELSTLLKLSSTITSTLDLDRLLELILDQLQQVFEFTGATVFALEEGMFYARAYRGPIPQEEALSAHFSQEGSGPGREAVRLREPIIIPDVRGDDPMAHSLQNAIGEKLYGLYGYIRCWMGVPLVVKERVIGILMLDHSQPDYYRPHHARLVEAFANQAAVAIENARLYEQAQELASLQERQKLARELHDSVSQALYGIALGSRTAQTLLARAQGSDLLQETLSEPLDYVVSLAEAGLAEMRALIFELRPESLEDDGLVPALSKQAASLQVRHHLEVETDLCGEPAIPLDSKQALYRIAQEAMHNTVKHAHASRVDLRLQREPEGWILLEVSDDGEGFDDQREFPGHLGLRSMRERAERLGGIFQIQTAPGFGTRVQVRIPIPDSQGADG